MATGAPGSNGVWLYGEDDSEATFSALLNKAGATVNTQFGLDRTRLGTAETNITNLQTAANTTNRSGLVPIVPSSIVVATGTGSVNSRGLVSVGGVTAVSLNGVFSSTYRNYMVVVTADFTTNCDFNMRYRTTSDDTTTNYYTQQLVADGTGSFPDRRSALNASRIYEGSGGTRAVINIFNPNQVNETHNITKAVTGKNIITLWDTVTRFGSSTVFTGFSLLPSAGNFTGTIMVYGMTDS